MGIANRDYYREQHSGNWGLDGLTPVVKYLIWANIVVFVLQIFLVRDVRMTPLEFARKLDPALDKALKEKEAEGPEAVEAFKKKYPDFEKLYGEETLRNALHPIVERVPLVHDWLALETTKVVYQGQVWRLFTHAFCHDRMGIFHIFFNMLLLYWFGCTIEAMYGSREFFLFYMTAVLVAALAYVGLDLYTGKSVPAVGASGAVMAVIGLYAWHYPQEVIRIWFLPIEMRYLVGLYILWDLHPILLALAGDEVFTGIAHAAHMGGLAFGFLYPKFEWRLDGLVERLPWPRWRWQRRPRLRVVHGPGRQRPAPAPETTMSRVDEVLRKIHESGQDSLNDEEREVLREASERLRGRHRRS